MGLSEPPGQDLLDPRSALTGEEPAGRRLPDAGRTGEKHVAQRLAPLLRGAGREEQVLDRAALADEAIEAGGRDARSVRDGGCRCFGGGRRGFPAEFEELRQVPAVRTEEERALARAPGDLEGSPLEGGDLVRKIVDGIESADVG